ncbi:dethiobiotin synthase [Chryseobacterium sp. PTM-20240506]|uniref:dethiobiotin synthase n=1 Tax=unclassified Chryseobacterium TaxID=2593645 RepID=UPI00235896CB|nr:MULTISPECIES: dethiobiotin synthase [unclassified Chryseobacterium]MDC8103953.1 dethiobiotin synthase [Chryseobacterium sp. B21-037]MDQ1803558.1 dethiobiotin synthase [Chryseobacterium sp. CKR4-1]
MKLFVTGIGTEIGKTVCSAILTNHFKADYWKPVQSGDLHYTDSMKINNWVGHEVCCYTETYRLQLAASPHQSAAAEGKQISVDDFQLPDTSNTLVVEGAGGLMVPLSDHEFMIDLIEKLQLPVALVVRNYLGCINHTLLSIMALRERGLSLKYLILNGSFPTDTERVIINYIEKETHIIRIPEIDSITKENIETISNNLKHVYNG